MDNDKTIQSYNEHIYEYVRGTPHQQDEEFNAWVDRALSNIPQGSTILELGSSFGRDADYIESKGYKVICSDAAEEFVKLLKKQGKPVRLINALTDDFGKNLEMIFANAVLLHFDAAQTNQVIQKVYDSLKSEGVFAFSLKEGVGEKWLDDKLSAPRFFKFWSEEELRELLNKTDFKIVDFSKRESRQDKWLQVILKK